MKCLFLVLSLGNSKLPANFNPLTFQRPDPSKQEIAFREHNNSSHRLSLIRSDADLAMLSHLNGWNRFGDFTQSAEAALLAGRSIIDHETYAQLASNGNLNSLKLQHSDALVMAQLVTQYPISSGQTFRELEKLKRLNPASADEYILSFATTTLRLSQVDAADAIQRARQTLEAAFLDPTQNSILTEHYLSLIERKLNLSASELTDMRLNIGMNSNLAQAMFIGTRQGYRIEESFALIRKALDFSYDWDSFIYILKEYSAERQALTIRAHDFNESRLKSASLPMSFNEAMSIAQELRSNNLSWGVFASLTLNTMLASGIQSSFPMPVKEIIEIGKAIQENTIHYEDFIIFFKINSYWPREGNLFDFKSWQSFYQMMHWYGKSLFQTEKISDDETNSSSDFNVNLFKPLTGKLLTAELIIQFATHKLKRDAYFAVFRDSIVKPQKGFLGWPWRTYFGDAPYDNYEAYIEATHAKALEAARK